MTLKMIFKAFAPVAALALAGAVAGCDGANVTIGGDKGKKLAELDLTGPAPDELVLLGPDDIRITPGDRLAISVEGDAEVTDQLRFTLKDGALGISRENLKWDFGSDKVAIVNVTMPAPRQLTMAGSGKILAPSLAKAAEVTIAGSGLIDSPAIDGESLELTIAGSGKYRGAGNVGRLELSVVGSGSAELDALKVDTAKITIAGSGDARFASDGEVAADIIGSGMVTVRGRARCTVSTMGSGKLVCESGATNAGAPEAPAAPPAPSGPSNPKGTI